MLSRPACCVEEGNNVRSTPPKLCPSPLYLLYLSSWSEQEVLRLAVTNAFGTRVKPVHFVSTNGVFPFSSGEAKISHLISSHLNTLWCTSLDTLFPHLHFNVADVSFPGSDGV